MQRICSFPIILAFGLVFLGNAESSAQRDYQHEIEISYGPLAREQIIYDFFEIYFGAFFGQPSPKVEFSNFYTATYRYQSNRRVAVSAVYGITNDGTYKAELARSRSFYKRTNLTMAFETRFSYTTGSVVSLYALTGLGLHLVRIKNQVLKEATTYALPTCQLTPIGIRIGKKFGGFAEIGYGYKGIINLGLGVRF